MTAVDDAEGNVHARYWELIFVTLEDKLIKLWLESPEPSSWEDFVAQFTEDTWAALTTAAPERPVRHRRKRLQAA